MTQDTRFATFIQASPVIGGLVDFLIPLGFSLWLPLGLWLFGARTEFEDWHGRETVRWQLMTSLYKFLLVALIFVAVGWGGLTSGDPDTYGWALVFSAIFAVPVLIVAHLVFAVIWPIYAAVQAKRGLWYVYPLVFSPRRRVNKDAAAA